MSDRRLTASVAGFLSAQLIEGDFFDASTPPSELRKVIAHFRRREKDCRSAATMFEGESPRPNGNDREADCYKALAALYEYVLSEELEDEEES